MSWLTRISQSKPMALPFGLPEEYNRGLEVVDRKMTDETANVERETMQPSYLGSGSYGLAANLPSGMVDKYTDDEKEAEIAQQVKNNPLPCLVNVHEVRQIQSAPDIWAITVEKVKTLSYFEQEIIEGVYDDWRFPKSVQKMKSIYRHQAQLMDDYVALRICLGDNRLSGHDAHPENIGYDKEGNLVLFDLGGAT